MDKLTNLQQQMYSSITDMVCDEVCMKNCNNPDNDSCKTRVEFESFFVNDKERNISDIFFDFFSVALEILNIKHYDKSRTFFEKTDLIDFDKIKNMDMDCSKCKGKDSDEYSEIKQKIKENIESEISSELITGMICYYSTHKIFKRKLFDDFTELLGLSFEKNSENHTDALYLISRKTLEHKIQESYATVKETSKQLNDEFEMMYDEIYGKINSSEILKIEYSVKDMENNLKKHIKEYYYKIPHNQKYIYTIHNITKYFQDVREDLIEKEFKYMPSREVYRTYWNYVKKSLWFCGFDIDPDKTIIRFPKFLYDDFVDVISEISKNKFLKEASNGDYKNDTDRWKYIKNSECIIMAGKIYELYIKIILIDPDYKDEAYQMIRDSFHCAAIPELLNTYGFCLYKAGIMDRNVYQKILNKILELSKPLNN